MGIRHDDLKDTILSKISIDEFEPKTGESKDVVVLGIRVIESGVGQDLYNFLNSGISEVRDVEVSPNPNQEGYYLVFVELDRNENTLPIIREIMKDIENVSGKLAWKASTHLTDGYFPLNEGEIERFFISDPEKYLSKEDWLAQVEAEEEEERQFLSQESANNCGCGNDPCDTLPFLKDSSLLDANIVEGILKMKGATGSADLEIVKFGNAKDVMAEIGISESAIKPLDVNIRKFNGMLGEMRAIPIDNYIVIFHPHREDVLVTKQC